MQSPSRQTAVTATACFAVILLCLGIAPIDAQENIQLQVPASLAECYNTSYFMNRDNRLPSNIETLISLVEKVENSNGFNGDIRTLASSLLFRFRQDGIQRAPGISANTLGVLPYSPTGFQFPKFRILLSRLISNSYVFPNDSLTMVERCSLHFMLSSSFDMQQRGDEGQVCSQLSQYRSQRLGRDLAQRQRSNFLGDVEIMDSLKESNAQRRGKPRKYTQWNGMNENQFEVEYGVNTDAGISQCPVENGVMWTPWGTVSAGNLLAGIAAGLQPQQVQLRALLALARRSGPSSPQTATITVDNRFAATLAGDLAEVALVQVPISNYETASVGANGAWNSTVLPRWYFLSQRNNLEMTDAEIRGGLDGLLIAMNISNWRTQASSMRLSQLLRMYYSMGGVLDSGVRACNRRDLFPNVAPINTLIAQTSAFAQVLDREMQLMVTLSPEAIANFSQSAALALSAYIPSSLNDVSCSVSSALPLDISESITPITNIYVFLDTTWQYNTIAEYVFYILQRLNINPFASTVTLLSASDGSVIVNTTNYLTDVYQAWNVTTHSMYAPGFNLPVVLTTIQNITQTLMQGQQTNSSVGGYSTIALMMPFSNTISATDSTFATNQLQYIYDQVPDLHFIYYAGGSTNSFQTFVRNPTTDLFALNTGMNAATSSGPVVMRIRRIPRSIINPRCGSTWYTSTWGTDSMAQYVRPGITNFYRMIPNYFFASTSGRFLNIQSQFGTQFTVCTSRTTELPMQNATTTGAVTDVNCAQVNSGNGFAYDLSHACDGYSFIYQCPALFVSVTGSTNTQTVSCNDAACQTPDQLKFIVQVVDLDCRSGVSSLVASSLTILLAALLRRVLL